jgi:hypothetical protein
MSRDNENGLQTTIEPLKLPAIVRTPSLIRYVVWLENLPWFEFQVLFQTFLKEQRSITLYLNKYVYFLSCMSIVSFRGCIDDCYPLLDHQADFSDLHNYVTVIDDLWFYPSMPDESMDVAYLLGQYRIDLRVMDEPSLGIIIDYLFTSWISGSQIFNTESNSHNLYSYFSPFILEMQDGELLEDVGRILGPVNDGFLQFLTYMINLLSNSLLSEDDVDKIVQ